MPDGLKRPELFCEVLLGWTVPSASLHPVQVLSSMKMAGPLAASSILKDSFSLAETRKIAMGNLRFFV